jgi:serine/threonine protein kinase
MVGHTISPYEILEKLGEGGMGVVYEAKDTHLDRFVAIKVLPPEKVADPERRRRFTQEAKAASALNHPNIITIHDIDEADGVHFISMEFVAGKSDIRLYEFSTGKTRKILTIDQRITEWIAVSPDGRTILYTQLDEAGSDLMLVENFR